MALKMHYVEKGVTGFPSKSRRLLLGPRSISAEDLVNHS